MLAAKQVAAADLPVWTGGPAPFLPVAFATSAAVVAGTKYAVVIHNNGASPSLNAGVSNSNPYAAGSMHLALSSPPSSAWNDQAAFDIAFKTYVLPFDPACDADGVKAGFNVIKGTDGADTLVGANGPDLIYGFGGNDVIKGRGGNDLICAGDGNDTVVAGDGADLVFGGAGNDTLRGNAGNDRLRGGAGNDLLVGGGGENLILGGTGHDTLYGGAGDDVLLGGDGDDDLMGRGGNDVLVGGAGRDIMDGGVGRDLLIGGANEDRLHGGTDDDILIGGYTAHDGDLGALDAIMTIWGSAASFESRGASLTGSGGLLVPEATVFYDNAADHVIGSAGRDLAFADTSNNFVGVKDTI
ncbi:calcium-binding protein, partial [Sporichthya sp.]|uniref:calcium-binding protein n=1 Tax=Sporichthya sp. TaxID=65475 RepID=UPI0017B190C3